MGYHMNLAPVLIVGVFSEEHLGFHLGSAAEALKIPCHVIDCGNFKSSSRLLNAISWRLLDRKLWHQSELQQELIQLCDRDKIKSVLMLGNFPLPGKTLELLREKNIRICRFLSDDPWNPVHYSRELINTLPKFDLLVTTRRSNLNQLQQHSSNRAIYVPFAYNPNVHFVESEISQFDLDKYKCDVLFFGNADKDRVPYISELIRSGFSVKLYGEYWNRFAETRSHAGGLITMPELRKAVKAAKVTLNLVRRANRDGHVMRTFEGPAMGGCMLNELTEEHLEILGSEGSIFFSSQQEMVEKAKQLISSEELRSHFVKLTQEKILTGNHTYVDRLKTILQALANTRAKSAVQGAEAHSPAPWM